MDKKTPAVRSACSRQHRFFPRPRYKHEELNLLQESAPYLENDMSLVSIPWPDSEPEATMIASVLYAYGIPFFVRDEELDGVLPGIQKTGHKRTVLVPEKAADLTAALLSNLMRAEQGWDWSWMAPKG
jgi:hypothetical protein